MEIILTSLALLTLLVLVILVGTGGRPMRFLTASGETLRAVGANRAPLLITALCVVIAAGFLYFFYMSPATAVGPAQPIPFSHRLHVNVKAIDCYFCHPYVTRSIHPGLPPVEKCLYCHRYIIANHPEIRKEHNYYNTGTPTPWVKAFYLAEHVVFNHQRHIRRQVECQKCHGPIEQMDRIKGQRFKMGFCVECHRQNQVNLDCWLACHS